MAAQDSFVGSLYSAILAQAAGGAQDGSSHTVLAWPGIPIDPQEYGNIWATDNRNGSPEALEGFSSLVDGALPLMSTIYEPGATTLETVYSIILNATVPAAKTAVAKAFDDAAATFAAVVRGSLANAEAQFHPSLPRPRNWCDPSGDPLWTTVTIGQSAAPSIAGAASPPPRPAPLPPAVHTMLMRQDLPIWRIMRLPPGTAAARRSPALLAETVHPAVAAPVAAVRIAPNVMQLRQNTQALGGSFHVAPPTTTVALHLAAPVRVPIVRPVPVPVHAPPPPPPARAGPPPSVQEQPLGATRLGASFRYLRVNIERAWLNPLLFRLSGWSLGGIPVGTFSNGSSETNPGVFPLLPIGFVAVRDLKISGKWTDADKATAKTATSGSVSAAFGPFTLATSGTVHADFDGSTLTVPGIQIIAWVCTLMPLLPPG
jgi:hypothetical protein